MIILEVFGKPINWVHHKGYGNRSYNPKHKEKEQVRWQIAAQFNQKPLGCPIIAHFTFYMPIPIGTSSIRKKEMLCGRIRHTKRPDRSNMLKFYEDCLTGIVIEDDSQIWDGNTTKLFGEAPKVLIRIEPQHLYGEDNAS